MEFLVNPRRAPRAPIRCDARVAMPGGGFWGSPTHDLGYAGCQLVAASPLAPGADLEIELAVERVARPVTVKGRVAWVSRHAPWHVGVVFRPESAEAARAFLGAILAAYPGLEAYAHSPERIPADAELAPGPPPRLDPEIGRGEAAVLAALGPGLRAGALRDRLGPRYADLAGPLFALIGRQHVVMGPPDERAAAAWARHVARLGP
jgi:hypothetical protein